MSVSVLPNKPGNAFLVRIGVRTKLAMPDLNIEGENLGMSVIIFRGPVETETSFAAGE